MSTPEVPPCQGRQAGRHSHIKHAYRPQSLPLLLLSVNIVPLQLNTGSELIPTQAPQPEHKVPATVTTLRTICSRTSSSKYNCGTSKLQCSEANNCSTHHAALGRQPPAATGTQQYGLLTGNPSWHTQLLCCYCCCCCCSCSCERLAHWLMLRPCLPLTDSPTKAGRVPPRTHAAAP
jgi:hypothetical protein